MLIIFCEFIVLSFQNFWLNTQNLTLFDTNVILIYKPEILLMFFNPTFYLVEETWCREHLNWV